jgi:hypothetical protein
MRVKLKEMMRLMMKEEKVAEMTSRDGRVYNVTMRGGGDLGSNAPMSWLVWNYEFTVTFGLTGVMTPKIYSMLILYLSFPFQSCH